MKRLAIMDSDGANHRFITTGTATALTPRYSPDYASIVYLSYLNGNPRIYVYDIANGQQKLVTQSTNPTFAPRWSPDGRWILYSMAVAGNTDIYRVSVNGGESVRQQDRVRERPFGRSAALCDERRRIRAGSDQLLWRTLRYARMEPAGRSDRLHPYGRQFPHCGDEPGRRQHARAD